MVLLVSGSAAFIYCEEHVEDSTSMTIVLVGWKGKQSVRAYVAKNDRMHYLRLINGSTSKFDTNKFEEERRKNNSECNLTDSVV